MTKRGAGAACAVTLLTLGLLLPAALRLPLLDDSDSYYHLAVAREYQAKGALRSLPWTRLSALGPGFGDKEYLFHKALAPLAGIADPERGGKIALALLWTLVAGALAALAVRAVGPWGAVTPLLLAATSLQFAHRLLPLRPESGALLLLLLATWAAGVSRYAVLGVAAFLFPLSWTGFLVLPGLAGLWFLLDLVRSGRPRWALVLWPLAGTAVGVFAHPGFPANLRVWKAQNVDYFRFKEFLEVGKEILPASPRELVEANVGWFALLLLLWLAARGLGRGPDGRGRAADPTGDQLRDRFVAAAVVFTVMTVLMQRFAVFAVPFVTLGVLYQLRERGLGRGARLAFPGGPAAFAAAVSVVAALGGLSTAGGIGEALRRNAVFLEGRREGLAAFGRAVPDNALVAAPWSETGFYVFYAPQGRYLNVLDPVFLYVVDPDAWRLQRDLFRGREPDIPLASLVGLQSRYLAFSPLFNESGQVYLRLRDDPRAKLLHGGHDFLLEILSGRNGAFALDWRVLPEAFPTAPTALDPEWRVYPRAQTPEGRGVEGFVDLARLQAGPDACATLATTAAPAGPREGVLELAPWGPTTLWVDGRLAAVAPGALRAVVGRGIPIPAAGIAPGATITVRTCMAEGRGGFFLLSRPSGMPHTGV